MVFQSYALYPRKTAFDNIASPLRARGASKDDIAAAVDRVANLLHIERLLQRPSVARVIDEARPYRHLFPLKWPADYQR